MSIYLLGLALAGAIVVFGTIFAAISRYKRCPSNKILVKYGRVGKEQSGRNTSAVPIHGGATFVWPIFQQYEYLDLTPVTVDINLSKALTLQNIRVDIPSRFTFAVSEQDDLMMNAAERLLGMSKDEIEKLAEDIILGQLRATIATMEIEKINTDREEFEKKVNDNVASELNKVGLYLINSNFIDIRDDDGYFEALGKEAAAQVTNEAKKAVAEKNRDGEIGEANANQEKRVSVAAADAKAVEGENAAKITKANSNSERRQKEAEADSKAVAKEKTEKAEAETAGYKAEQIAEQERMKKEQISKDIEIVVPAEAQRKKAKEEAEAEMIRISKKGEGEGLAIQKQKEGEAEGNLAILEKKAEGLKAIVDAANGDVNGAAMLLIVEQLPVIAEIQAQAISNIDFGNITVIDSGGSNGEGTATGDWLQGIGKSMPGFDAILKTAGLDLPEFLGSRMEDDGEQRKDKSDKSHKGKEVSVVETAGEKDESDDDLELEE